jgi:hydroxyethylthiazole kinase
MAVAAALGLAAAGRGPKGVDSVDTTDSAEGMAVALAGALGCVVAATGAIDLVTDGTVVRRLANGSPLMAQVTAVGCSLSAITAAFCAVEPDALEATTAALAVVGIAGECAAETARLPGSFRTAWLDQLAAINGATIAARLRLG